MTQFEQKMAKLDGILECIKDMTSALNLLEERSRPNPALMPHRGYDTRPPIPPGRIPPEVMEAAEPAKGPDSANVIAWCRENFSQEDFETFFPLEAVINEAFEKTALEAGEAPSAEEISAALDEKAEREAAQDQAEGEAAISREDRARGRN